MSWTIYQWYMFLVCVGYPLLHTLDCIIQLNTLLMPMMESTQSLRTYCPTICGKAMYWLIYWSVLVSMFTFDWFLILPYIWGYDLSSLGLEIRMIFLTLFLAFPAPMTTFFLQTQVPQLIIQRFIVARNSFYKMWGNLLEVAPIGSSIMVARHFLSSLFASGN